MRTILLMSLLFVGVACIAHEEDSKAGSPVAVVELLRKEYPKETGSEVRMMTVEYIPGGVSKPHSHPGAIYAYVLEGSIISAIDKDEPKTYKAGEFWYEPPGCTHSVSRNASATEKAKILVFFVTQPGNPVVQAPKQ